MPALAQHTVFTAFLAPSNADTVAIGKVLVLNAAGTYYVVATTAARSAASHRCAGIALTAGDANNPSVELQSYGEIPASVSGLAAGSASWVRVSSTGTLERVTPSGSDEIAGYADADGTVHLAFGVLTVGMLTSSTPPTGTGWARVTSGAYDAAASAVNLAGGSSHVSGTLPVANGGTGLAALGTALQVLRTNAGATAIEWAALSVSVSTGISGLGANVSTWLATPSSANLASAVTDETGSGALVFGTSPTLTTPVIASISNTGTLTLPTSTDTLVGRATTDTLTNKTINGASNTLTVRIGSDVSGLATGMSTWLATPSSANLAATVTDETGSGALVFGTSPTLGSPVIGTIVSGSKTWTVPSDAGTDTFVGLATSGTLTNKTLTSPVLGGTPQYTSTRGVIKSVVAEVQTTDATVTTCGSYTMSDETLCAFDVIVTAARRTNVTKGGRWKRSVVYRRTSAGAPTIVGTLETGTDQETDAAWDVTIDVSSNDVRVRVTGAAATNVNWITEIRVQELPAT